MKTCRWPWIFLWPQHWLFDIWSKSAKLMFSEKAKKIWRNHILFWRYILSNVKKGGWLRLLWPSQNLWTLINSFSVSFSKDYVQRSFLAMVSTPSMPFEILPLLFSKKSDVLRDFTWFRNNTSFVTWTLYMTIDINEKIQQIYLNLNQIRYLSIEITVSNF